jgi:hypothetical protein
MGTNNRDSPNADHAKQDPNWQSDGRVATENTPIEGKYGRLDEDKAQDEGELGDEQAFGPYLHGLSGSGPNVFSIPVLYH